jgi:hypothetical protein
MKLHEAIRQVLIEAGRSLSADEIATRINSSGLYLRKDGQTVSKTQVLMRIQNYEEFVETQGAISLKGYNKDKSIEEQVILLCRSSFNFINNLAKVSAFDFLDIVLYSISYDTRRKFILTNERVNVIHTKLNSMNVSISDRERVIDYLEVELIKINKLIADHSNRPRVVYEICNYLFSTTRELNVREIPNIVQLRLKDLIENQEITHIDVDDELLPLYFLLILNTQAEYEIHYATIRKDFQERLESIFRAVGMKVSIVNASRDQKCTLGICFPSYSRKSPHSTGPNPLEAAKLQGQRLRDSSFQLFMNVNSLFFAKGSSEKIRNQVLDSHCPSAIYSVPFESKFVGIKSLSVVEFDSKSVEKGILMADFKDSYDSQAALSILMKRSIIEGVSSIVSPNQLFHHEWVPSRYIHSQNALDIASEGTLPLEEILSYATRGRFINKSNLNRQGEIRYLSTKDLNKDSIYFKFIEGVLGFDSDVYQGKLRLIKKKNVIVSLIGEDLKPNVFNQDVPTITTNNLIALECNEKVIPEYLVLQLKSEYCLVQIKKLRLSGIGISHISQLDLMSIRIKVPSIDDQKQYLLDYYEKMNPHTSHISGSDELNFIATLKHTLQTPISAISQGFNVLQHYLLEKINEGVLDINETIVPVTAEDEKDFLEKHTLINTLFMCQLMLKEADNHLNKAEQFLKIESMQPRFERTSLKNYLKSKELHYPTLKFDFKGRDYTLSLDKYSFGVLVSNLIDNAVNHGFQNISEPKVLFRTELDKDKFGLEFIKIQYFNNGLPMSEEITTESFLRKNSKSSLSAGDGYGGSLIQKVIQIHHGVIEVDREAILKEQGYNVCFTIYLPYNQ